MDEISKLTSPCATLSDAELLLRVNQSVYALEQLEKKLKDLSIQILAAIQTYDVYYSEYTSRFGDSNSVNLTEFQKLNTKHLCDTLDKLAAVLDFSRKNPDSIDVISETIKC